MNCEEIDRILSESKSGGVPDNLTSLLTVLRAFQCREGFVEVVNERMRLVRGCENEIWNMRKNGVEPHPDIVRLLEYFKGA